MFAQTKFPNSQEREDMAQAIGLTPRQVQVWFQVGLQSSVAVRTRSSSLFRLFTEPAPKIAQADAKFRRRTRGR
jgi:hypothetical protein